MNTAARSDSHFECCVCHARIKSSNRKYTLNNAALRGMVRQYKVKNELNLEIKSTDWLCVQCQSKFRENRPLPGKIVCRKTKSTCISCAASAPGAETSDPEPQSTVNNDHYEIQSMTQSNNNEILIGTAESTFDNSVPFYENASGLMENELQLDCSASNRTESIELTMKAVIATENCCFICKEKSTGCRSVIPASAILDLWINFQIYVPPNNRCCKKHIENEKFKGDDISKIQTGVSEIQMNESHIKYIISSLTTYAQSAQSKRTAIVDFSESSLFDNDDYELLLGLSKENFLNVFEAIKNRLRSSSNRSVINALAMFLMKLRLDLSQEVLALLFNIRNKRAQATVSETLDSVAAALKENFVPKHLGYDRLNDPSFRQSKLSPYAAKLLNIDKNSLIIILDGTYLYVQKPSDFKLQKLLYSGHKYRNLAKPMMVVFPNGHILHVEGLFGADGKNSDALILNAMLKDLTERGITSVLNENDGLILDRGFRDSVINLESRGYSVFMPSLLQKKNCSLKSVPQEDKNENGVSESNLTASKTNQQKSKVNEKKSTKNRTKSRARGEKNQASGRRSAKPSQVKEKSLNNNANQKKSEATEQETDKSAKKSAKQFTCEEANQSRIVTMLRWVVEAVNGRVKSIYKFFGGTIPITYLPKLGDWFQIACALCNAFSPNIFNETDEHLILADRALERTKQANELEFRVKNERLDTKTACWVPASMDTFPNFPELSLTDLKTITLGVYQVNLAEYYAAQHVKAKGFEMQIHKDVGTLIRGQVKSRFSAKIHKLWIEFDSEQKGAEAIKGYYCKCQVGARVVGCCAHVASFLWFLGYARHNREILPKRTSLADKIMNAGAILGDTSAEADDAE